MPKVAQFMETLTHEQDKMVIMGTIKHSKEQDLVARDSRVDSKLRENLKIHLRKRETNLSLNRSPKNPRRTPRRRRKNYK